MMERWRRRRKVERLSWRISDLDRMILMAHTSRAKAELMVAQEEVAKELRAAHAALREIED